MSGTWCYSRGGGGSGPAIAKHSLFSSLEHEAHRAHAHAPSTDVPMQGVLAERMRDEADLPARVLPLLAGANPMDAWAVALGKEEALAHPRSVSACVCALPGCALH